MKNELKGEFWKLNPGSFEKCFKALKMISKVIERIFGENENGLMDFEVI